MLDELRAMLTTEQQKVKPEQIENCQLSLIALSEKDAYIEGFKLGVRMAPEIYADTQQWGYTLVVPAVRIYRDIFPLLIKTRSITKNATRTICEHLWR